MSDFAAVVRPYGTALPLVACASCGNRARWTIALLSPLRETWGRTPPRPTLSSCGDCLEGQLNDLAAPPPQPVTVEHLPGYGDVPCACGQAPIEWDVRSGAGEGRRIRRVCTADLASACRDLGAPPLIEAEVIDDAEPVHYVPGDRALCGAVDGTFTDSIAVATCPTCSARVVDQ